MTVTWPAAKAAPNTDCAEAALCWLGEHQGEDGSLEGEVVWCPIILAQYVIVSAILGATFDEKTRLGIIQHFEITRRQGLGWGLHPESEPYVFVTTLAYIALRLLGMAPDDPLVQPARLWLRRQSGGVLSNPTWGKFWLAMLGLYEYSGLNPIPPELVLLPRRFPFHPDKLYCHTRHIYMAMACLYARRFRVELKEVAQLRCELYSEPYSAIDFASYRHNVASTDLYVGPNRALQLALNLLSVAERIRPRIPGGEALRRRAVALCVKRIAYEQSASRFQSLSPVGGLLNTLVLFDDKHPDAGLSLTGLEAWRWEDPGRGVRLAGARSNAWDTAFAIQAIVEHPALANRHRESVLRAYRFLRDTQIIHELQGGDDYGRDRLLGGWCFGDGEHRWPVLDCTAEALVAILGLHQIPGLISVAERIPDDRLALAVAFILSRQNPDGGFGTYERRRGGRLLEIANPFELFGHCMTEASYIECTSSAVKALARCRAFRLTQCTPALDRALRRACQYLQVRQRTDGSYPGSWGINFTYATFFVMEALRETGETRHAPLIQRATHWLLDRQRLDGGWGEHFASCLRGTYREHSQSQAVMTAWALLALLPVLGPRSDSVERGLQWLRKHQTADGSWPEEAVNGVFFGSAMLDYCLYRIYFPAWALARAGRMNEEYPD
jgi:lanosterol synthase